MDFGEFILAHAQDNPAQLALSRARFAADVPDFDLALTTLEVRQKLKDKVPEWYAVPSLQYPLRISGEQCSSSQTARYKAFVMAGTIPSLFSGRSEAEAIPEGIVPAIADLTGGLGVDSWAFAKVAGKVLYNEMRPELARAAAHNFRELGATNILVQSRELCPGNVADVLGGFRPDVIFLDPARRAADGRKVFRLEDCQPDVLRLLPELLDACPRLLLKLSPMADITLVCKQLACVKAVHVVAAERECKELLLVLEKDWSGPFSLTVVEDGAVLEVPHGDTPGPDGPRQDSISGVLFEPGKALLKAGAFELPCSFGLSKLGRHTHLFTGGEVPEVLRPFGKSYHILEAMPLDKRSIKAVGQKYPQAEVTARNIPITSEELRKKLGVKDGGPVHIFGLHADRENANLLIICAGK